MNEQWILVRKGGDYVKMGKSLGVSPVVARIMKNRGLEDVEEMKHFLEPSLCDMHSPKLFKGMNILVKVMTERIKAGAKIRIIGDYDVDGISSTYILYRGLTFLGADCDYRIPHRVNDGYGINIRLIDEAHADGIDTIITCDNGISAREQTEHANDLGMTMVITDHHEVPFEIIDGEKRFLLPNADAIVDPKLPGDTYPFSGICGAVVAYKVILELAEVIGREGEPEFKVLMSELTENAAIATVCDVMELKDENRAIVREGLKLLRRSKNMGMRALIKVNGIEDKALTPYHLGFILGPCLNASGRLDTAQKAMELLLCNDPQLAEAKAVELKEINENRKQMTLEETGKAINLVLSKGEIDKVLVVFLPDCHESLAGIIAGKVRERFSRPSFVLTRTENGLKGSGRSIDAYDMYEGLTAVSEELSKFGGHKLAAGISLSEDRLESFTKKLNDNCSLTEDDFKEVVRIDMELPLQYANLDLCNDLEKLEPCGTGNERPLFARTNVTFISGRRMGSSKRAAKYRVTDEGNKVYEVTYFGDIDAFEEYVKSVYGEEKATLLHSDMLVNISLDICFQVGINTYRGAESAQITMKYFR
ncbi:MAG: single-stranded-DNA-specific exonuclease RecJ [Lachnospiraceae bacterium]|nr:single-stranded-DNA-specific exonuclease RecJ [Lachnospiraceae bacterium]